MRNLSSSMASKNSTYEARLNRAGHKWHDSDAGTKQCKAEVDATSVTARPGKVENLGMRKMDFNYSGKVRHHNHSRFSSNLQDAICKLTQLSKCLSHSTHASSFHSRLEPNKFRSPSKPATTAQSWLPQNKTLGFPRCATKTPQSFRHIPNVSSRSQQPQELYSLSIPHPRGLMRTETQLAGSKQIHGNSCQRNGNHERKYATDMQIHITLRDEVNRATFRLSLPSVSAETAGISKNKNTREPTTYQIGIQSWFQNLSPPLG